MCLLGIYLGMLLLDQKECICSILENTDNFSKWSCDRLQKWSQFLPLPISISPYGVTL